MGGTGDPLGLCLNPPSVGRRILLPLSWIPKEGAGFFVILSNFYFILFFRRLYFSDGYNLNVQYIAMDTGSFDPVPLELSNRKLYVEEMAFDELKNVLYWCDKSREVIEKYDVVSGNVTELISNANNITG